MDKVEQKVRFFKALGDETRLRILKYLLNNDYCACEFESMVNRDQTTVSRHLKLLVDAGILEKERNGRNIVYRIKNDEIKNTLLYLGLNEIDPCC
ncbi:MAG: metalloregulator ArsR/SmtB family transcription factor [Archaeoglobaceae archaeon]